ncbi:MAG TPA: sialate O-acetylesterase [Rariglobus sp.]
MNIRLCLGLLAGFAGFSARADIVLPAIFADHLVLQQGRELPLWGWADPAEKVVVSFKGATASAMADADGRWKVTLPAQAIDAVGGELVFAGKNRVTLKDVVVGEVWLCSGQSNMEWPVEKAQDAAAEIAAANFPAIRQFLVKKTIAELPAESVDGRWAVCSPETVGKFTAVGYFFARDIHRKLGLPVGLIHSSWGGTPIESWMSEAKLKSDPAYATVFERRAKLIADFPAEQAKYNEELAAWEKAAAEAKAAGLEFKTRKPRPPVGPGHPYMAITLYNGMIRPLVPYAMRGVLWYQGESNAGSASRTNEYQKLFPALIEQWRAEWGQGDFPFYYVQLANFKTGAPPVATGVSWAFLREAQTMTLSVPNTGMAVTIDIGNPDDVHPLNKQEVGRRLALIALAKTYGKPDTVYSGPVYRFATKEGDAWRVHLSHADGLRTGGGAPKGFQIAGEDGLFVDAEAALAGDGTIRVRAASVTDPAWVRYAWINSPDANVFNGAGLPMVPFRTDTTSRK